PGINHHAPLARAGREHVAVRPERVGGEAVDQHPALPLCAPGRSSTTLPKSLTGAAEAFSRACRRNWVTVGEPGPPVPQAVPVHSAVVWRATRHGRNRVKGHAPHAGIGTRLGRRHAVAPSRNRQRALARAKVNRQVAKRAAKARRQRQTRAGIGAFLALAIVVLGTVWLLGGFDKKPKNSNQAS